MKVMKERFLGMKKFAFSITILLAMTFFLEIFSYQKNKLKIKPIKKYCYLKSPKDEFY